MIKQLPTFKGWTIDARLKQLRFVHSNNTITFLDFESDKGDYILTKYMETLDPDSEAFNEIARAILGQGEGGYL